MFRLKELEILGSKAELAALPEGKLLINTINAHSYNTARKDKLFAEALTNGDVLIPDGVSIVKACKWIKAKSQPKERIAGWDLFSFEMGKLERESEERRVKSEESSADNDNQVEGKSKIDNSSSASADNSCLGKRLYEPSATFHILRVCSFQTRRDPILLFFPSAGSSPLSICTPSRCSPHPE